MARHPRFQLVDDSGEVEPVLEVLRFEQAQVLPMLSLGLGSMRVGRLPLDPFQGG
jgi:hypothetical protein